MARTDHSRRPRRVPRNPFREGSSRTTTRTMLAAGRWDDMPTSQPTRINRRPNVEL